MNKRLIINRPDSYNRSRVPSVCTKGSETEAPSRASFSALLTIVYSWTIRSVKSRVSVYTLVGRFRHQQCPSEQPFAPQCVSRAATASSELSAEGQARSPGAVFVSGAPRVSVGRLIVERFGCVLLLLGERVLGLLEIIHRRQSWTKGRRGSSTFNLSSPAVCDSFQEALCQVDFWSLSASSVWLLPWPMPPRSDMPASRPRTAIGEWKGNSKRVQGAARTAFFLPEKPASPIA